MYQILSVKYCAISPDAVLGWSAAPPAFPDPGAAAAAAAALAGGGPGTYDRYIVSAYTL